MTYEKIFGEVKKSLMKADVSKLEKEFAIQCNIHGEGEGSFYVAFKDGIFSVEPYDYKDNNAQLFADGDTFIKMFAKKISGFEAHDQGLLGFEGDLDAVLTLGGLEPKAPVAKKSPVSPEKNPAVAKATEVKKPVVKKPATVKKSPVKKAEPAKVEPKAEDKK